MDLQRIDSADDPRLAPFHRMKDRELAREGGLFITEGALLVRRLVESDFHVGSILLADKRFDKVRDWLPNDVPVLVAPNDLVERVVGFQFHAGVVAFGRRKPTPTLDDLVSLAANGSVPQRFTLVVCPEVINHENMGGLVRIAAAFGAGGMLVGERSCDPFWRRSIRVSMGSVFTLPIRCSPDLRRDLIDLSERWGFHRVATVTDADADPLAQTARPDRLALLLGSESQGLGRRWTALCDQRVTIPMHLGADSLNVAVAAAVSLFHYTQGGDR